MTDMSMLVSVIIPAYNREKTVIRAVKSVLAQTYNPLEIILVDDGSNDNTVSVVEQFSSEVRIIRQKNQGPSAARNNGIRNARGAIISFLDSDDAWLPTKLERQVELMKRTSGDGVICCVCNAQHHNNTAITTFALADLSPRYREGLMRNPVNIIISRFLLFNQVVAVRREAFQRVGLFNEKYRILEDYEMALRLATTGPWGVIRDPLVDIYDTRDSLSKSISELDVQTRALEILEGFKHYSGSVSDFPRTLLNYHMSYLLRCIWARKIAARGNGATQILSRILLAAAKLEKAVYSRSPLSPKLQLRQA